MEPVRRRSLGPTAGQERYEFLDVLRGLALAGIVLANMISLSLYLYLSGSEKAALSTASTDRVLDSLELVLIESKFYTIFSVLFGIGFSILMTRAEAKGLVFRRFFLRRALFLYLIYLVQLAASRAWLGRFQYGPLEWLWRMLTYGAAIPLRRA